MRSELVAGAALTAALALAAAAAPWLSPAPPEQQLDPVAGRYLPPGSSRLEVRLVDGTRLLADRVEPVAGGLRLERLGEDRLVPADRLLAPGEPRPRRFPLGTDAYGRDVLSRLLWGARVSLTIGTLAALLALVLGTVVGGTAGMLGGAVDSVLMRLVDALLAFPRLFLVIALAAFLEAGEAVIILVLGCTGWMGVSRIVRAEILSLRRRDFVLAAEALGQPPHRIFLRHLLPNALTPLLVHTALRVGDVILVEAALSFIGLGIQPPRASWGNMVAEGAEALVSGWWISTLPGVAIVLAVMGFNLLGDGLRDALDPRSRPATLAG